VRRQIAADATLLLETDGSHVVYALGINAQREIAVARRLLERRIPIDATKLADTGKAAGLCARKYSSRRRRGGSGWIVRGRSRWRVERGVGVDQQRRSVAYMPPPTLSRVARGTAGDMLGDMLRAWISP
jgi:hypothetical protein